MLGHAPFYNEDLKNVVTAFGTLFNDIKIIRSGGTAQTIKVPLTYASKDKAYVRRLQDSESNYNMKMQFPRLAFNMIGVTYDPQRRINNTVKNYGPTSDTRAFHPVPYDIELELYVATASVEDGLQIIEQILPFFAPEYTVTMNKFPEIGLKKDIPFVLNSVTPADNTPDSSFDDFRVLEWTLNFTAKAWIGGPKDTTGLRINTVNVFMFNDNEFESPEALISVAVNPSDAAPDDVHTKDVTITETT